MCKYWYIVVYQQKRPESLRLSMFMDFHYHGLLNISYLTFAKRTIQKNWRHVWPQEACLRRQEGQNSFTTPSLRSFHIKPTLYDTAIQFHPGKNQGHLKLLFGRAAEHPVSREELTQGWLKEGKVTGLLISSQFSRQEAQAFTEALEPWAQPQQIASKASGPFPTKVSRKARLCQKVRVVERHAMPRQYFNSPRQIGKQLWKWPSALTLLWPWKGRSHSRLLAFHGEQDHWPC